MSPARGKPALPPSRRERWINAILVILLTLALIATVTVFVLSRIPAQVDILVPDAAEAVSPKITVQGHAVRQSWGQFYMTFVGEQQDVNLLQKLLAGLNSDDTILPRQAVAPASVTPQQLVQINAVYMHTSEEIATIVALNKLGYQFPILGVQIEQVASFSKAKQLAAGDIIISAQGTHITSVSQLQHIVQSYPAGTMLTLTVWHGNGPTTMKVSTVTSPQAPHRAAIGVGLNPTPFPDYSATPYHIVINAVSPTYGNIGGPSAGLAFTLGILQRLSSTDLAHGHKIAVTGTIDLYGNVGAIGGVKQKVIGARWAGAQYFILPYDNLAEARPNAHGITLVPVHTLAEALAFLQHLH